MQPLPPTIDSEEALDELLTRPGTALLGSIRSLSSPLLVLGAGGKMGPSLAVLAKRAAAAASHPLEVCAVSRFRDESAKAWLESHGVRTIAADLFDEAAVRGLPDTVNLAYLVGLKFGTAQNPAATWAANTLIPSRVSERFPGARIVALSTGNVYPFVPPSCGGAIETDPLTPLGEYANAAVARERIFDWYSIERGTPIALFRLSYAVELRYGVLVDLARKILGGEPIDLANGHFNCIWQGDANDLILRGFSLASTPASSWNLCLPEQYSVREIAARLGELMGREPEFGGRESGTALLSNTAKLRDALGDPALPLDTVLPWVARWVKRGGRCLDRPTHFETRDGRY